MVMRKFYSLQKRSIAIFAISFSVMASNSFSSLTASAQSLSGPGTGQSCQDTVKEIERELAVTQQLQTDLDALNDDIDLRLVPFEACQRQTMVYVPGHTLADNQGCLDTRTLEGPQGPTGPQGMRGRSVTCYR